MPSDPLIHLGQTCSWKEIGELATKNTWFENLWQLCSHFGIKVHMEKEIALGPVREGDVTVNAAFWDVDYRGADF